MKQKKEKQTGLSDKDKLMFENFAEWFNLRQGVGTFLLNDPEFLSFKSNNGLDLDYKSPIPSTIKKPNAIFYKKDKSAVWDLARHIRNAHAHSRIRKEKGYFVMTDINRKTKEITMQGKISIELMPLLLKAIRDNKRDRSK